MIFFQCERKSVCCNLANKLHLFRFHSILFLYQKININIDYCITNKEMPSNVYYKKRKQPTRTAVSGTNNIE